MKMPTYDEIKLAVWEEYTKARKLSLLNTKQSLKQIDECEMIAKEVQKQLLLLIGEKCNNDKRLK